MTDRELKKLRRQDLLEILLEQSQEIESLNRKLCEAEEQLKSRQILLNEAGTIAEAALRINGVFEAAQAAAEQYLENIRSLSVKNEGETAEGGRQDEEVLK